MASFEVTPADLQSLAGHLSGLLGELEQASAGIDRGAAGAARNGRLEGAISSFLGSWSADLHDLQSKLGEVSQRLEAGGSSYEGTESSLASGLGSG